MAKSYANLINDAKVMTAALRAHKEKLAGKGITDEYLAGLEYKMNVTTEKNRDQEKLKADLKKSTADLNEMLTTLQVNMSEATSIVKHNIPKEQWIEFGITAKR